ncbi:MAG TPA: ABC transporter permease, partial [Terriglobia bacterium]|nr:ABC transporter permease [Terriglobia bacterium]
MPPVFDLPVFGYLAIALLLIGGIALMPRLSALIFSAVFSMAAPGSKTIPALALARLANAPNQAAIALGGVVSSFSLVVAMAIMVTSFRVSVDDWLRHILPADLYLQTAAAGDARWLYPEEIKLIAAVPGISRIDFLRSTQLMLDPARPAVALTARPIEITDPGKVLPMTADVMDPSLLPVDATPIWVSEAMVDLYGFKAGTRVDLPLGQIPSGRNPSATLAPAFVVAGVWRDYGRQFGAIQMRLSDYRTLTGDQKVNDA